jgi:DNA adenine methylase
MSKMAQSHLYVRPLTDLEFEAAPSPLIYPGGKSRAIPIIVPLILQGMQQTGTTTLVSPFLGGGNLEVTCARNGVQVFGSDVLGPLVNFWQHVLSNPDGLSEAVQKYLTASVNDNAFRQVQEYLPLMPDGLEKAAVFYVVNRHSYLGLTLSGGMRSSANFGENQIEKLRSFHAPLLTVDHLDFRQALMRNSSAFAYLDPPYEFVNETRNRLYGVKGDAHRGFDHDALFEAVADRKSWIMSLNADQHVLDRYAGFPIAFPRWSYGMSKTSASNEVLIFSNDLADLAGIARARIAEADADNYSRLPSAANDHATVVVSTPWPQADLTVLNETATPPPPFPHRVLGEEWMSWCRAVAAAANAPVDFVVMSLIAAGAGLIGNSVTVRANNGFVQPSVLWVCLVGKSGSGKTPAMNAISDIVDRLDRDSPNRQRIRDVSVAASIKRACLTDKGLMLVRDEVSGWWNTMKRSGGEDFWLEAFNGQAYSKDRAPDISIVIDRLSVSVLGGAQPATVRDITTDGKNRGFSSRWLFAFPDPVEGYAADDCLIDTEWATAALARLKALPVAGDVIPLSPDAQAIFRAWWDAKKRENADHDGLWAEWLQKQGGNALRIALVLEMLQWSTAGADTALPMEVTKVTLQGALTLLDDWAIPMAQRTLEVMYRSSSDQHAAALAKLLRRLNLTSFNARRLRRGELGGPVGALGNPDVMDDACHSLMQAGLIRHVGMRNHYRKGRAPLDYETNPVLFEGAATKLP